MSTEQEEILADFQRIAEIICDPKYQAEVERMAHPRLRAAWEADRRFRARSMANGNRTVFR